MKDTLRSRGEWSKPDGRFSRLLLTFCRVSHSKGTKIPRREGSPMEVGVGFGGPNTYS